MREYKKDFMDNKSVGSWLTIPNPAVVEIMARAGFDWLVVDMEHSPITLPEAENMIRVIDIAGVVPFVRLPENRQEHIARIMDAGAYGIVVPMVNSREDAERAVRSVYYPPRGKRGVGLARAQGYGTSFDSYRSWLDNDATVIVQIEHKDAVANIEEILSTPGVDGFIVGPYDLSASLGIPGQFDHPDFKSSLERITSMLSRKKGGYHIVPSQPGLVTEKFEQGYSFVAYGVDFKLLGDSCRTGLAAIRSGASSGED